MFAPAAFMAASDASILARWDCAAWTTKRDTDSSELTVRDKRGLAITGAAGEITRPDQR